MHLARLLVIAAAFCATAVAARASASDPVETTGATLRLITTGLADRSGRIRGALEIRLAPGWKTYWKEPGASGVPPQIGLGDSVNISSAEIHYPAPEWHEDAYGSWAGYDRSFALPITFRVEQPDRFSLIDADFFGGICETICVPVQARLTVDPGSSPDDPADKALVEAAHAALPDAAHDGFGLLEATVSGDVLRLRAVAPGSDDLALFLAAGSGYAFGRPAQVRFEDGAAVFEAPILARPAADALPVSVSYTLTSGAAAVTGEFTLPR